MIKYSLQCAEGHEFEAWFASSTSYDAPAVSAGRSEAEPVSVPPAMQEAPPPQLVEFLRELRRSVVASSEDVGDRFPEEARKIHYGDAEERNIRGTASGEEAEALSEEGIEIVVLPPLPEDTN